MSIRRKTKIVATLGPATQNETSIRTLLTAGVNVFRLNFSHGTHKAHEENIRMIREQSAALDVPAGVLADLQGPKIRTGRTQDDRPIQLKTGTSVTLTVDGPQCDDRTISVDYPTLAAEIHTGQIIVLNDGAVRLHAERIDAERGQIACTVTAGGEYASHKGVNLPNAHLSLPSLTGKDRRDLSFILTADVQYIALSFVRSAADILALKAICSPKRPEIQIIAKIEKPEAAADIDEILEAADGIMVARGDLGVECAPFEIPVLQKDLIQKAQAFHKPVIVATQMLESMTAHPLPTRAESTDVANAIFDGTDAVMLSGETAVGEFPIEAVSMMARIAETAEQSSYIKQERPDYRGDKRPSARAICEAAAWAAEKLSNVPVCVFTLSGDTAVYLSKLRSPSPIFAFSPNAHVVNLLSLTYNVTAFHLPFRSHMADLVEDAETLLLQKDLIQKNDRIVIISGTAPIRGATDLMQVKRAAGEPLLQKDGN